MKEMRILSFSFYKKIAPKFPISEIQQIFPANYFNVITRPAEKSERCA